MWMNVVVVDQSAVNTDQIIPGEFLTDDRKEFLAKGLFAGMAEIRSAVFDTNDNAPWVVLARDNFGSGSSREHAVWALQGAGCAAVVAQDFARIFRRNAVNSGLLPIALPENCIAELIAHAQNQDLQICYDISTYTLQARNTTSGWESQYSWALTAFERFVVNAGGLLEAMES